MFENKRKQANEKSRILDALLVCTILNILKINLLVSLLVRLILLFIRLRVRLLVRL